MTQTATVQRILSNGMAEIAVPRKSACGHDCEECAGCGISGSSVLASAANPIGAVPGEKVIVETSTRQLLGINKNISFGESYYFFDKHQSK